MTQVVTILCILPVRLLYFWLQDGWSAVAEDSGHVYPEVDFSEREWVEWDEKMKRSVGIYNVGHQFVRIK
jgi:hypothetical protein